MVERRRTSVQNRNAAVVPPALFCPRITKRVSQQPRQISHFYIRRMSSAAYSRRGKPARATTPTQSRGRGRRAGAKVSEGQKPSGAIIGCVWCETHVDGPCPQCAKLRRQVVRLRERMDTEQVARELSITPQRAARLLAQVQQADALAQVRQEMVPVTTLRSLYERRRAEDSQLTEAALARAVGMARIDLRRALGHSPCKARNGTPSAQQTVKLHTAERIAAALGVVPADVTRM
jgi:hypothetical protein